MLAGAPWFMAPCLPVPSSVSRQAVCARGRDGTSGGLQSMVDAKSERRTSITAARMLLATGHDPEVLEGAASSLTSGCLPGSCRTMAHSGWLGGQFH